ncbi:histidine phosphatase family protein [Sanguibacter hominis ATCC BAA-789]|uniref:Histidine phosphatase family protein n=1 Tax=Sanguibacter hominis ATCC BAA-789 TaxID=1312740 RepID=A0A9X5FAA2_9MICO|nr:histidine phosphatase family protein [Sanguibacter hominis]NKX92424.1 histidine phosphatase family protein [Sanguibacter hominis ATCC BAA-789]
MTTLLLVRHGQTVWHEGNRYAGSSDVPLTDVGHEQAQALARWAATARLDAVWSSTLQRAIDTAAPAAEAAGLELRTDARLVEVAFGKGEGLTRSEMGVVFPDAVDAFLRSPASVPLPGGERGYDAIARAAAAFREICAEQPDGRVLVVAHSTLLRLVLCALLGIDPESYRQVFPNLRNATVTTLDLADDGAAALDSYNVPIPA